MSTLGDLCREAGFTEFESSGISSRAYNILNEVNSGLVYALERDSFIIDALEIISPLLTDRRFKSVLAATEFVDSITAEDIIKVCTFGGEKIGLISSLKAITNTYGAILSSKKMVMSDPSTFGVFISTTFSNSRQFSPFTTFKILFDELQKYSDKELSIGDWWRECTKD